MEDRTAPPSSRCEAVSCGLRRVTIRTKAAYRSPANSVNVTLYRFFPLEIHILPKRGGAGRPARGAGVASVIYETNGFSERDAARSPGGRLGTPVTGVPGRRRRSRPGGHG